MNKFLKYFKPQFAVKEEEFFKNQISAFMIFGSCLLCMVYIVFGYHYSQPVILYTNLFLSITYVVLFLCMHTQYTKIVKLIFIVVASSGLLYEATNYPKNALFNILYSVVFFLIFIIFDSNSIKEVSFAVIYMICSYLYLEFYFIHHDFSTLSDNPTMMNIVVLNAIMFAGGLISIGYYYVDTNKQIFESISEKETHLEAILENSQNAIWAVDNNLNIITYNENFAKFCEITESKRPVIGEPILKHLSKRILSANEWNKRCSIAMTGKKITEELSFTYEGNQIFVEVSLFPIKTKKGDLKGIAFFGKDVTKRKNSTTVLIKKNEELVKANEELDRLVYRASHDLKAPLMSVLGLINITEMELKDNAQPLAKNFEMMRKSVTRLDSFIKDMIDLSRNSRLPVIFESFNFETFIKDTISTLQYYENAPFIKIDTKINYPFEFYTDTKRIEIIINNLISNAIKYHNVNQENPWIKIEVNGTAQELQFVVEENGRGIPHEHLEKIFDMFYRADHNAKGSGIGLYIVKETILKLGGTIEVMSAEGRGSKFIVILPNKK